MKIILIILALNMSSFAATKNVVCGFGECRPDFNSSIYLEKSNMTFIDAGDFNEDEIQINLPSNQEPRALFFSVNNNDTSGKDLFVNLQSKRQGFNSADFVLVGDVFDDVNLTIDGYEGVSGKSASEICAEKVLASEYGEFYKNQFLSRRTADINLPADRCVEEDVEEIQRTSFSCLEETSDLDFIETEFSLVNVERVKFKQKCTGTSQKYKCVKRKVKAECQWESLPLGSSVAGKPCTNKWGGNNCEYSIASSCWGTRDLNRTVEGISSYPEAGASNPWEVYSDNSRCSYPAESSPTPFDEDNGMSGGAFAFNTTVQLQEKVIRDAERNGELEQICQQYSSGPTGPGWRFVGLSDLIFEQPGLDEDTLEPLPGSTWEVAETGFFEECSIFGDFEVLSPILEFWITYGEIGNSCSDVSIAEDPDRRIPWSSSGTYQDRNFGTELLLCSPDNCSVETITKRFEANQDIIVPTAGTSGTTQGDAILFVYDIDNLISSAEAGLAGTGGNNDLPKFEESKYCVKKQDSNTQGINSEFALEPVVYFNEYKWDALKVGPGQPGGSDAPYSTKGIKLYKKIDSSVRYLLKNDNF
jgi:hypothetical protein